MARCCCRCCHATISRKPQIWMHCRGNFCVAWDDAYHSFLHAASRRDPEQVTPYSILVDQVAWHGPTALRTPISISFCSSCRIHVSKTVDRVVDRCCHCRVDQLRAQAGLMMRISLVLMGAAMSWSLCPPLKHTKTPIIGMSAFSVVCRYYPPIPFGSERTQARRSNTQLRTWRRSLRAVHCSVGPQAARAFTHRMPVAPPSNWSVTT